MWDIVALVAPRRPARRGCTALAASLGAECSAGCLHGSCNGATGACECEEAGAAPTARARSAGCLAERMECATRGPGHASASCRGMAPGAIIEPVPMSAPHRKACITQLVPMFAPPWYGVAWKPRPVRRAKTALAVTTLRGAALAHRASLAAIARCSRRAGGTHLHLPKIDQRADTMSRVRSATGCPHSLGRHHAARGHGAISALQRAISAWKAIVAPSGCWPNTTATSSIRAVIRAVGSTRRSRAGLPTMGENPRFRRRVRGRSRSETSSGGRRPRPLAAGSARRSIERRLCQR